MGLLAASSLAMLVLSVIALPLAVSLIPADYFAAARRGESRLGRRHPAVHALILVAKNLLGAVLLVAGLAMLVLPGQGLLTIIVALIFLDFPGKYRLEQRLVASPLVVSGINWLRRRAGVRPLILPDDDQR
jgi:hypothetical protein